MKILKITIISVFFLGKLVADPVILVAGGAGYIGSHTCKALKEAGFLPVTYDSLGTGSLSAVQWGPLVVGDLLDQKKLDWVFETYQPIGVIHLAAYCNVRESVMDPLKYYVTNGQGSINLLNVIERYGIKNFLFSSSCTVYDETQNELFDENSPKNPSNPYAFSKYAVEQMIQDCSKAYDFRYVILRYFNVAGIEEGLSRSKTDHFLIPKALKSLLFSGEPFQVFGNTYPTPDGTAIRDYIHVKDLARAHVLALQYLLDGKENTSFNLGTGQGYSVLEVLRTIEQVTGRNISYEIQPKKVGDAPQAVAQIDKAKEILHFEPRFSNMHTIIESEWESIQRASNEENL